MIFAPLDRSQMRQDLKTFMCRVFAPLEHEPLPQDLKKLSCLNHAEFEKTRADHMKRKAWPDEPTGVGVALLLSFLGVPACLFNALIAKDPAYLFAAVFWLVVGLVSYGYLALAAGYWREHRAIMQEEQRRSGRCSFS